MNRINYIVSLIEPINIVRNTFNNKLNITDYDSTNYVSYVLSEILDGDMVFSEDAITYSTKTLMEDSLTEEEAKKLSSMVLKSLIDILVSVIPNIDSCNSDKYGFKFINTYDIMLTNINGV